MSDSLPIYEQIDQEYDLTRKADPYIVERLADYLKIQPNSFYLDVACGTGNYTIALAALGGHWHGIDQSQRMIKAASCKSQTITWKINEASALPYSDSFFSGVLSTLAIHHFKSLNTVFQEIYRVLSQGCFALFTATSEQMERYWLIEYFPNAIRAAAQQMPSLATVKTALQEAGFNSIATELYMVQPNVQDLFLYSGKHRPDLYLNPNVRAGISTFVWLATDDEVQQGCQKLAADIQTGMITEIIEQYTHDQGDYLFVVARK